MTQEFYCPVGLSDQCEALSLARIPLVNRMEESALYTTCWYDYRMYHPVQRIYLWVDCYVTEVRNAYRAIKDAATALKVHPFGGRDVFYTNEWIGALQSRQAFDRLGIRYDFGLRFALKRAADRGWKVFPRPNQLYQQELIEDVRDAWYEECKTKLQIAQDPLYKTQNFAGHPDQIAYRTWLNAEIRKRASVGWALATPIAQGIYSTEDCVAVFGPEASKQATKLAAAMVSQP